MNLIWEHLLPAMQPAPLLEDSASQTVLTQKLASLAMEAQQGQATSPLAAQVSGKPYIFEENELGVTSISLDFPAQDDGASITIHDRHGEHRISTW